LKHFTIRGQRIRYRTFYAPGYLYNDIVKLIKEGDVLEVHHVHFCRSQDFCKTKKHPVRVIKVHSNWYELESIDDGYRFTYTLGDLLLYSNLKQELSSELKKYVQLEKEGKEVEN